MPQLQADCLSFDDSDEGESFRRHQSRSTDAALRIVRKFRRGTATGGRADSRSSVSARPQGGPA